MPENHKRSLSVLAHHIENSLDEIVDLLSGKRTDKVTEKINRNISDENKKKILKLVAETLIKNEKMFNELYLDSSYLYEDRIVRGNIGHIWTILCDSTPEALKGYGKLTTPQAELLNIHINDLLYTVNELQSLIK